MTKEKGGRKKTRLTNDSNPLSTTPLGFRIKRKDQKHVSKPAQKKKKKKKKAAQHKRRRIRTPTVAETRLLHLESSDTLFFCFFFLLYFFPHVRKKVQ